MNSLLHSRFYYILSILCLCYFGFECFITYHTAFVADDFWFTHWIYQFKHHLPYRDFVPHTTVLGYYLLLPAMQQAADGLAPLYHIKLWLALINACCFFGASCWLTRFFPRSAVLCSAALLIAAEFFLSNSTHIRIDILAYWFCLAAFLLIFENKFMLAGVIFACGFCTSQKTVWFIFAANVALTLDWLMYEKNWRQAKKILLMNGVFFSFVMLYLLGWSAVSSFSRVMNPTFFDAYAVYQLDLYLAARKFFWSVIFSYNAVIFLLWPVVGFSLLFTRKPDALYRKRFFIMSFTSVILVCLIVYKQIFPYYTLATLPAFLMLYAAFFAWLFNLFATEQPFQSYVNRFVLVTLAAGYIAGLFLLDWLIPFPALFLSMMWVPVLLVYYLFRPERIFLVFTMLIIFVIGLLYPLINYRYHYESNNLYQKNMFVLMQRLLHSGGDYLAGVELFYDKNQTIPGLKQLDWPALNYLRHPNARLAAIMTTSLDHTMTTPQQILSALQQSQVKLYLNNYRMDALPDYLKNYLAKNYQHFWGSVYLYAPTVSKDAQKFNLKFAGDYLIENAKSVRIDGHVFHVGEKINLQAGWHVSQARTNYRLRWMPREMTDLLDARYREDKWADVFP